MIVEQPAAQTTVVEQPAAQTTVIKIEPANPQVVYVPTYNPTVVYGAWPYPAYPPYSLLSARVRCGSSGIFLYRRGRAGRCLGIRLGGMQLARRGCRHQCQPQHQF